MQNALYVEISVIGISLLLVILFNQHSVTGSSTVQRHFNRFVYATIAMLIADAVCWLLDGAMFPHARTVKMTAETLYFILNTLLPYLWVVYVELYLSKDRYKIRRRLRLLAIPLLLVILLALYNLKNPVVFTLDENNRYQRNIGYFAYAIVAYTYLGIASAHAFIAGRRAAWAEQKRSNYLLAGFVLLPAIGGVVQTFFYGVTLIWVFIALSTMMMYIDSLNRQISTDPLTGINNRRELTKYLFQETKAPPDGGLLALIMMDVDGFKQINDTYGHHFGDQVLVEISEILKQSCKNTTAFLARYGGDEFCLVYHAADLQAVEDRIASIQANVVQWKNDAASTTLSIGYSVWDPKTDQHVSDLFKRADHKMYQAKSAKKCEPET